jgi:acyl-CoA synthetase (NDP forming)
MNLDTFFNPKTVAVIGVSSNPQKIGRVVFDTLLSAGKKVYPVNPNAQIVSGVKCYASIHDVVKEIGKIDVVVIAVPVEQTLQVMEESGKSGIKNAVIITAGFKEVGNVDADNKLTEICKRHKINVIGPNCLGILNTYSGFDAIFLPPNRLKRPKNGGISFLTQSGATGSVILDRIGQLGVSKFISYGNALNLNECDYLEYLGKDKTTKIICIYLEAVKDGKRFLKVVSKIKKPIVVLKGGKTKEGSKATLSHTGSLAGDAEIYSGVFKQLGIIEVYGIEQMIDVLAVLNAGIRGKSIGIVTNGGGYGILSVDDLVGAGLDFRGPVMDLFGDATTEGYRKAIANMKTDIVMCNALFQTPLIDEKIIDVLSLASKKKKIVVVSTGSEYSLEMKRRLIERGVCVIDTPEEAVDALRLVLNR